MRRTASEIIRDIEMRVARLEKSSSPTIRVKQVSWEDDTKENKLDEQTESYTFKELHSFLSGLESIYRDRGGRDVIILAGYGDYSGNLVEIHIKDKDLLNLLISKSFNL